MLCRLPAFSLLWCKNAKNCFRCHDVLVKNVSERILTNFDNLFGLEDLLELSFGHHGGVGQQVEDVGLASHCADLEQEQAF